MSSTNTEPISDSRGPADYWNPYVCGVLLGAVLIVSYVVLGTGVGASSGLARLGAQLELWVAPTYAASRDYFGSWGDNPLSYYLVYMFLGTILGGAISAVAAGRLNFGVERGRSYPATKRMAWAIIGGILIGFASRLARGCTSGQALSGGALLLTGSFVFIACVFASGYAVAFLFRRQWND